MTRTDLIANYEYQIACLERKTGVSIGKRNGTFSEECRHDDNLSKMQEIAHLRRIVEGLKAETPITLTLQVKVGPNRDGDWIEHYIFNGRKYGTGLTGQEDLMSAIDAAAKKEVTG
jgi:hypothetical protein